MARMTAPNRFAVRLALVTGTTVATIVGAQTLASLDAKAFSQAESPAQFEPIDFVAEPLPQNPNTNIFTNSIPAVQNTTTQQTVTGNAAPNIVIIRHSGSNSAVVPSASTTTSTTVQSNTTTAVQPPSPSIAPPAPAQSVVVRSGPVTRSSR